MLSGPRGRWDRCCHEAFGKTRAGFRRGAEQAPSSEPFPVPSAGSQFPNPSSPRRQKPDSVPWENNAKRTAFNTIRQPTRQIRVLPSREGAVVKKPHGSWRIRWPRWVPAGHRCPFCLFLQVFAPTARLARQGLSTGVATAPGLRVLGASLCPLTLSLVAAPPRVTFPWGPCAAGTKPAGRTPPGLHGGAGGAPALCLVTPPSFPLSPYSPARAFQPPARRQPKFPERASARGGIPQPCARGYLGSPTPK